MNSLILVLLTQSLVSAKFNRRASLTKYHKDAPDAITTPNDVNDEQPAADSAHGLLGQKRRQKMFDLTGQCRRTLKC